MIGRRARGNWQRDILGIVPQIGVAVLKPQRQPRTNDGFDTAASGPANPGVSPGPSTGRGIVQQESVVD